MHWLTRLLAASVIVSCSAPESNRRRPVSYYVPPHINVAQQGDATAEEPGEAAPPASCEFPEGQLFPGSAPWNQQITEERLAKDSAEVIAYLHRYHQSRQRFRTDFSFVVLETSAETERKSFQPSSEHYHPDCDTAPVPIVPDARIEGEPGYACTRKGDCHLLVHVPATCSLYEMWKTDITSSGFSGGCLAVWDTRMDYGTVGRGDQCTSADASGMPITPLLFSADDLARGSIDHAIRLILPNKLIRRKEYVPPATHSTGATKGPAAAPPYGGRFRLRKDVDVSRLSKGAQVVVQALKKYGMIIVDGGQVSFTAISDKETKSKWSDFGFDGRSLESLKWTDFELVDAGISKRWTGDCRRSPVTE